jgi:hypothetical protein
MARAQARNAWQGASRHWYLHVAEDENQAAGTRRHAGGMDIGWPYRDGSAQTAHSGNARKNGKQQKHSRYLPRTAALDAGITFSTGSPKPGSRAWEALRPCPDANAQEKRG